MFYISFNFLCVFSLSLSFSLSFYLSYPFLFAFSVYGVACVFELYVCMHAYVLFVCISPYLSALTFFLSLCCLILSHSGIAGTSCLASALKSVVIHRWHSYVGGRTSLPDHASFVWICQWHEIDSFRWFISQIKGMPYNFYLLWLNIYLLNCH